MRRKPGELIPLEVEVLEAAVALQGEGILDFHGYSLAKSMKTRSGRRMLTAHGTLYRALHRLERAKLLEAFWEDPSGAEQEGRPRRRLYRLTALAAFALNRARSGERASSELRSIEGGLEAP